MPQIGSDRFPGLGSVRRVRVGSTNGPKLAAVRAALRSFNAAVEVEGIAVASGVPDQPVGLEEIAAGARNRAEAARAAAPCDLAVGIEDGLVEWDLPGAGIVNLGCAAVTDGVRLSLGFSAGFAYPPAVAVPAVRDREPIGALFDRLWEARRGERPGAPSGATVGNIGKLTGGVLPRGEYARHAVLCALVRFLHPDLYALGPPEEPSDREAG